MSRRPVAPITEPLPSRNRRVVRNGAGSHLQDLGFTGSLAVATTTSTEQRKASGTPLENARDQSRDPVSREFGPRIHPEKGSQTLVPEVGR